MNIFNNLLSISRGQNPSPSPTVSLTKASGLFPRVEGREAEESVVALSACKVKVRPLATAASYNAVPFTCIQWCIQLVSVIACLLVVILEVHIPRYRI